MNPSVDQPAAEREPDHVTPCWACHGAGTTGSLDTDVFECTVCDGTGLSAKHRTEPDARTEMQIGLVIGAAAALPAYAAMGRCPCGAEPGYLCQNASGEQLGEPHPERLAAGPQPDQVAPMFAVRPCGQIQDHEPHEWPYPNSSWWCEGGWTVDQFAEVFPERIHFDAGHADQRAACGFDLDRQGPDGWTTEPAKVKCAECAAKLPTPAEPERRTVSLEVLTAELRNPPADPDVDPTRTTWIPDHARVGLVLRADGQLLAVAESDADWVRQHGPVALLARMLQQAEHYARDGEAELLMPTPDVLAALDGRPDAQLLTAPAWVLAMDIEQGMLLAPLDSFELHRVTGPPVACGVADCKEGASCVVVLFEGGRQHQSGYARTRVRIPVSVTR